MKILNFGSMNLDYVYDVPHFVQPGETLAAKGLRQYPGGKGLNQSLAIARAGGRVHHAGFYGLGGEGLQRLLQAEGVNTDYLRESTAFQGQAVIQVNREGENCIILYSGSNHSITAPFVDEVLAAFGPDTLVVLQNEISCVEYIIDAAHARGMKIVLNPSPFDERMQALDLSKIAWLLFNEVEGEGLSGRQQEEEILARLGEICPDTGLVFTMGGKGAVCKSGGNALRHGTYNVPVVDTTAAGDTFTGYFIAGLAAGKPLEETIATASRAASLCVSRPGASPSIPTLSEVLDAELIPV